VFPPSRPRRAAARTRRLGTAHVVVLALLLALPALGAAAANPFAISYSTPGEALMGYARPGGLAVVQTEDPYRVPALIDRFRARGGEVLVYVNLVDGTPFGVSNTQARAGLYGTATGTRSSYLWRPVRFNYRTFPLLDIRRGSAFSKHAVAWLRAFLAKYRIDGVFLDVLGSRLWSSAWDGMSASERAAWSAGARSLVSRIRAAVGPRPILVSNNFWDRGVPALNGFVVEHHPTSELAHIGPKLTWSGWHRPVRNLVIASGPSEAEAWRRVRGVSSVSPQTDYTAFGAPLWGFRPFG
jgi:hypothetical protein